MNRPIFLRPASSRRIRTLPSLASSLVFAGTLVTVLAQDPAPPAKQPLTARDQAQNYLENDEARKAAATLVEAARANPADRVIGSMLYGAIRDHVWHIQQTLPIVLDAPVRALAFNLDGSLLASGADSGMVVIAPTEPLDEEDAKAKRVELKLQGAILGVYFSSDGKRLATASAGDGLKIWDVATRAVVFEAPKPAAKVTAFAKMRTTQSVAIGMEDGSIQVVDLATNKVLSQPEGAKSKVIDLAFSPDGKRLGAAWADQTARVWEAATGKPFGEPMKRPEAITSIDFNYDGRYLVIASGQEAVMTDPESGVAVMPAMKCSAAVKKVRVGPTGWQIATMLDDGSVKFWDAFTGKQRPADVREDGQFNDILWGATGFRILTASQDNHATVWSTRDGVRWGEELPHDAPVLTAAFRLEGMLLATSCTDGKVRIWRMDGGKPMPTVRSHSARARTAFYSIDGNHLVTTAEDHTALLWVTGGVRPSVPALKHKGKVLCGNFDKDATRVVTCDDTGIAQIWTVEDGKPDGAPYTHKGQVTWVHFHPDGQRFVATSGANAFIWSVNDRKKPLATITHPGSGKSVLKCARFSPDGKLLVTASTDGTARLWDATSYKPAGEPIKRGFPVLCVRFSPDGSRLVVTGEDAQAAVYDTATWKTVGQPILFPGPVFSAAITPDNRFLTATSFLLNAVQYFEIETGRALGRGAELPTQATCVAFHAIDQVATVACDDGTIRSFGSPFVSQDVPAWACDFVERLVGLRKTGPDTFERVDSHFGQLQNYVTAAAKASNADFARLVTWKMTMGTDRTGYPRFVSTIAQNIERRVEERSVDALYECYEAAPVDPLVLAALSLYLPSGRQSEFLADLVVADKRSTPLALAFAAGELSNLGRSDEAQKVMARAVAAAPNDPKVLRRQAKLNARLMNKELAIEQFEKALALEPNDFETRRAYAWALYNLNEPGKAAEQFRLAQDLTGELNSDLVAGLCLSAAAIHNNTEATTAFRQLVAIDPVWKEASYIAALPGWTQRELRALETVRSNLFLQKR